MNAREGRGSGGLMGEPGKGVLWLSLWFVDLAQASSFGRKNLPVGHRSVGRVSSWLLVPGNALIVSICGVLESGSVRQCPAH